MVNGVTAVRPKKKDRKLPRAASGLPPAATTGAPTPVGQNNCYAPTGSRSFAGSVLAGSAAAISVVATFVTSGTTGAGIAVG